MTASYETFLEGKRRSDPATGIEAVDLTSALFPFQRDLVTWALRRGRAALFAGTGLGKTLMQLAWADAVERHTGKPVLILTPLAVAHQTVAEAARFGFAGVAYAADQGIAAARIVVTNYDRFERFDITAFGAVVLDESSIIKAHDSKTRAMLIASCRNVPFKLACTATPAPNDWIELGNHSEFLGSMTEKEMLAMFFVHDGSMRVNGDGEWRLKSHATDAFWQWVSTWAALVRSPADLGYDDGAYRLPELRKRQITVPVEVTHTDGFLFPMEARTLQERIAARRSTVASRAQAAADVVNADQTKPWLIWCNLNAEADALAKMIPGGVEVRGTDAPEVKAERLLGFANGSIRILITKPSVAGFGMNFQHCSDMVFVGLTDSFEQVFQAIRRCWRFGQTKPVTVTMIAAETEGAVVANLEAKERAFEEMGASMAIHMADLVRRSVRSEGHQPQPDRAQKIMEIPTWLAA